jgi:hypothetical protein
MSLERPAKTVGRGRTYSPAENRRRAEELQQFAESRARFPRPRGFVLKAKTWEDYERWRRAHPHPRLW